MIDALELLQKAAIQFRFYETNHRTKASTLANAGTKANKKLIDDTLAKADANAGFATEIEEFLADAVLGNATPSAIGRIEMIHLLRSGHDEIVNLRRRNDVLEPKAHAYDTIAIQARLSQHQEPQGYGLDAAWAMGQAVEQLVRERDAAFVGTGTKAS